MYNRIFGLLPAIFLIIAGIVFLCTGNGRNTELVISETFTEETSTDEPSSEIETGIWVFVSGCVKHPGVYHIPDNSRIFEAVTMAGGMTADADSDYLNLAGKLSDGQHIYVPEMSESNTDSLNDADGIEDGLININTAALDSLKTLPGIGETKARAIIDYREKSPFVCIEDIMNVSGIKESSFNKIKDKIKV